MWAARSTLATDDHVSGEELALLAMDAQVPDSVRQHVATCNDCTKDLSVVRSLLSADPPDSPGRSQRDATAEAADLRLPPAAFTAMADTASGRRPAPEVEKPSVRSATAHAEAAVPAGGRKRVIVILVAVILAVSLLGMVMLLWR